MKVSYGCMRNLESIVNSHNKKILENKRKLQLGQCNCRVKDNCPLQGHCLTDNLLYKASLSANLPNYGTKVYKGISHHPFKLQYNNHKKAFNIEKYKNDCELSKEVWRIKDKGGTFEIKWEILQQLNSYSPTSKRCALCMAEKLSIIQHEGDNLLNKRTEIVAPCKHKWKYKLASA